MCVWAAGTPTLGVRIVFIAKSVISFFRVVVLIQRVMCEILSQKQGRRNKLLTGLGRDTCW